MKVWRLNLIIIAFAFGVFSGCKKEKKINPDYYSAYAGNYVVSGVNSYWIPDSSYYYPISDDTFIITDSSGQLFITSKDFILNYDSLTLNTYPCDTGINCFGGYINPNVCFYISI